MGRLDSQPDVIAVSAVDRVGNMSQPTIVRRKAGR
jgi:hypothetical protein